MASPDRDPKAEFCLQRHDDLLAEQRLMLPLWQEIADYVQPRKGNVSFTRSPGQVQTDQLMDSTAPHALTLLAASMQGALTSSAFRWFSLRIKGVELQRDHQVNKLLEACSLDMYDAFNESNFASEIHEVYLDAPCFGIAAMFCEERTPSLSVPAGALRFNALAPGSFSIDEDEEGRVDTVYRKFKLSARAAALEFGKENVGGQVLAALKQNSAQRFEFLHAVYPREDAKLNMGRRLPANKLPYASLWIDIEGRKTMREAGYPEPCIVVPRWTKISGEMYGHGPGVTALPDIKTLNKAVELKLKAWAKVVDPPVKARDEGILGDVDLKNGGITYVRDMDAIAPMLELGGNLNVADMEEEKLRQSIRRMFFSDQLQMQEGPQMTAYEVQVRYELMQRILGPALGRTNVELLNPVIERVFWIRLRASAKNSPYRMLEAWCKKNGVVLDIEYEGPLAKAQRLQESVAMQRLFQIVLPLQQVKDDVMDNFDLDYGVRAHADSVGTPEGFKRSEEARDAIRAARTKAQEQMAAQAAANEAAKAGGDVAPLLTAMAQTGVIPEGGGAALTSG